MAHAIGGFIGWIIAGVLGALPAWMLQEWGRQVLFGPRDRNTGSTEHSKNTSNDR